MRHTIVAAMFFGMLQVLHAQVPFDTSPTWASTDITNYSTGAAWADLNRDGWLDFVVANGNDMARQRVAVYYNVNGVLPPTPDWQSADIDYHGHLSIGDVNGDGYPDVAVSVYIGPSGFSAKGKVKLYLNANGTLGSSPVWTSGDLLYTFSCAFGDADGDGDLDLAVAGGESYNNRAEHNRIYFNSGGMLDSLPGWLSSGSGYSYDVTWVDIDNNGDLDLVFANERGPNHLYKNYGDSIGTVPVWASADPGQQANSVFAGDINNDGYRDIAISDNNQLGGTGRFKLYLNTGGTLAPTPFWTSAFSGYGSGINLVDVDDDGDLDLITGGWWQPCRIYTNNNGTFTQDPQWTSATNSVVEAIVFGDFDNDGLDTVTVTVPGDGVRKLFLLPRAPAHQLLFVAYGADTLAQAEYCYDLEDGWISCATPPQSGQEVHIGAVVSRDLDFAVSNWDPSKGNYVFANNLPPVSVAGADILSAAFKVWPAYPNPFNPTTTLSFTIPHSSSTVLKIFDVLGRQVATLMDDILEPGKHSVAWDAGAHSSGVYFYQLTAWSHQKTGRIVLIR